MKRLACILFVLAFLVCGLGTARASNILYFVDCLSGTDAMALALAGSGHSVTTVGSSADFATQIGGGGYDLGVFMVQGSSSSNYGDGITALGSFVASGGRAIYTDWSIDNTYAALFDAAWSEPGWDYENY
ncbi:MAG: hypothetical protein SVS15_08185, partial [Thermodesulfobacteriota bacterium]|nr:hypothetical protein [Thermodesulfobacteriota bacterium]